MLLCRSKKWLSSYQAIEYFAQVCLEVRVTLKATDGFHHSATSSLSLTQWKFKLVNSLKVLHSNSPGTKLLIQIHLLANPSPTFCYLHSHILAE